MTVTEVEQPRRVTSTLQRGDAPTVEDRNDDHAESTVSGKAHRRSRRASERPTGLEQEGEIAADYLEGLLDIADLDGDIDMDVEGDRAAVSIVGGDLDNLVGRERRGAGGAAGADPAGRATARPASAAG